MKRKSLLIVLAVVLVAFAFVSCSGNVAPEDRLGTISFGANNTRVVTTVTKYSSDVEDLVWFYKATKLDDGYTTGQTTGFVAVAAATSSTVDQSTTYTPTKGLSGKTLNNVFSYGLWKMELEGYKYEDGETGTKNVEVSSKGVVTIKEETNPEYTSTISNHLVDKGATYATAEIEVGENAETKIEFGEISFVVDNNLTNLTKDSNLTLSVEDGNNTVYSKTEAGDTTTYSIEKPTITIKNGTVTVKSAQLYYLEEGNNIVGDHTMNFVLSQELKNKDSNNKTTNTTIEAALYTLKFTVKKGTTTTISGTILKNDNTGTIQIDSFQDVEPIKICRTLDVKDIGTTANTAVVSQAKTIQVGSMKVTYPEGALISTSTDSVTVADSENKTGTADAKQGIVRDDNTETSYVSIGTNESKETYQLTLVSDESAASANSKLVVVEFFYGKNREVRTVYHNETEIVEYSTLATKNDNKTTNNENTESYSYNAKTGYMTLRVFHASPITIVAKEAVAQVGETNYYSLADAIAGASENGEVRLLNDCVAGKSENLEYLNIDKSITIDLADKTLDLEDGYIMMRDECTITFKNGKIESEKQENDPVPGNYIIVSTGDVTFENINFEQTGTACTVIYVWKGKLSIIDSKFNCRAIESVVSSYNKVKRVDIKDSEIINTGSEMEVEYEYNGSKKKRTFTPAVVSSWYGEWYIGNSTIKGTGTRAEAINTTLADLVVSNHSTVEGTSTALNIYDGTVEIEDSEITATEGRSGAIAVKQEFGKVTVSGRSTIIKGYCALNVVDGHCKITGATVETSNTSDDAVIHVNNKTGYGSPLILNKVKSNPDSIKVCSEGANGGITSEITNRKAIGGITCGLNLANFSGYNN